MREIRFRVWDGEIEVGSTQVGRFRYDCFLSCGGELFFNDGGRLGSLEQSKFVVQLATGLKDRNGIEIFEGDWLEFGYHDPDLADFRQTGEVFWSEIWLAYGVRRAGHFLIPFHDRGLTGFLVVGNVHESPELKES